MVPLVIIALMFVSCQAFCPVRLPQDEPWWSPCKLVRHGGLTKNRNIYVVRQANAEMPYNRLDMTMAQYLLFLKTNKFLSFHAIRYGGQLKVLAKIEGAYLKSHALSKQTMTLVEYAAMRKFFRNHVSSPLNILRKYMKFPSDYEPFQSDYHQWISDKFFAEQRLAGVNPMTIQKVTFSKSVGISYDKLKTLLNPKYNFVEAVNRVVGGVTDEATLKQAVMNGRLFVLYHPLSSNAPTMPDLTDNDPNRTMWTYMSPITIFASKSVKNSESRLTPVAIQMDDKQNAEVFTPQDGDSWMLAKLNMQLTDLFCSQVVEHLSKTHFVAEAICLSVERQLSVKHPLYDIMRFHCRGVFTVNTVGATPSLLTENQTLHQISPYGHLGSMFLTREAAKIIDWSDLDLRNNLKRRGVDDETNLPFYPYRDDGLVIFDVLKAFVTDYVNSFYSSDYRVDDDKEMQSFAFEISAEGNGKIRGFPASIESKASLIATFTRILWVMVGQHTAINYPQSDYALYVPNLSSKLYDVKGVPNNKFSAARLTNRQTAARSTTLFLALASLRLDQLFDYAEKLETRTGKYITSYFKSILEAEVEPVLKERNKVRKQQGHLTYPYLQPSWLTNGIQS